MFAKLLGIKKINREKKEIPKTVQKTIPYLNVYDDGIIEVSKGQFSKTISFLDVNYQTARQEDQENIFVKYGVFLNSFDPSVNVEITFNNKNINRKTFEEDILISLKSDKIDIYRKEYNQMLQKQLAEGKNEINREKYITITIKSTNIEAARAVFIRMENENHLNLKRLGSDSKTLSTKERLEIIHDFYKIGCEGEFLYEPENLKKQGITEKEIISPDSFLFKRNYFMMGEKYGRALFLSSLPSFINDKFLSEMTDFRFNMMLSLNIQSVAPEDALKVVKRQITGMESNKMEQQKRAIKSGYDSNMISHDLKHSLAEAEELLDDLLNKNQKMFLVNLAFVHVADSLEQLNMDTELLKSTARKYLCQISVLNYQQEDGLASVLPLGNNKLKTSRTLTTESTAIFMPFTSQELIQKGGMYYGLNAVSRNLIIFNRKSLKNPNGFILGTPGSGKSFSAKREMVNVLLNTDDDVLIIDPEREYSNLAQNFGGEIVHISAGSKNHINPLDLTQNYSDDDDPMILKAEFVLSLCECLIGGKSGLTAKEKTIIDRCLKKTYAKFLQSFDRKHIPTLLDFQSVLEEQNEPEAREIALALEIYTKGSLSIFAKKTNINLKNRFVIFDIKDLGKQLKTMGMLIVLDAIWNRITENREKGKRTWIYMDEIYLLFNNEYSANFLFELYKRARKWGAIPTGITQNVEDLLKSELARRMLSNSDFIMMLNQATTDRNELAKLLNISEVQLSYVTNSDEGQGLLFSGNSIIPFVDRFPTNTKLYKMMTTKVEEVINFKKASNE